MSERSRSDVVIQSQTDFVYDAQVLGYRCFGVLIFQRSSGPNGRQEVVHFLLTQPLASRLVTQCYI